MLISELGSGTYFLYLTYFMRVSLEKDQLYGRRGRGDGSSRSYGFSGRRGCFSPAVKTRSSLRPIRLCAYRPSSTNSAAKICTSSGSLGLLPRAPSLSVSPWIPFNPCRTSLLLALSESLISPPKSNHCTTCCIFTPPKYSS